MKHKTEKPDFQSSVLEALSKLGTNATQPQGISEVKSILSSNFHLQDRLAFVVHTLSHTPESSLTPTHKREFIKLYGLMCEVLEEAAVPLLPRILAALQKKLKEGDLDYSEAISSSYGAIVHNTLHTFSDLPSANNQLEEILSPIFNYIASHSRNLQVLAACALTKIIQHTPIECLQFALENLTQKLVEVIPVSKAQAQLLEALISLILSVEQDFEPYAEQCIPVIFQSLKTEDNPTKKQALDALYTLGAVVPGPVESFAEQITKHVEVFRSDKNKNVRDACLEALNLFRPMVKQPLPPKEPERPRSIFKGPVNNEFFKPEKVPSTIEVPQETPPKSSESEQTTAVKKLKELEQQNEELVSEFSSFRKHTQAELVELNQRLGSLEEIINTVTQLFEAKLKQLTSHPNIARLIN